MGTALRRRATGPERRRRRAAERTAHGRLTAARGGGEAPQAPVLGGIRLEPGARAATVVAADRGAGGALVEVHRVVHGPGQRPHDDGQQASGHWESFRCRELATGWGPGRQEIVTRL